MRKMIYPPLDIYIYTYIVHTDVSVYSQVIGFTDHDVELI